jgi:hypothetical protein
MGILAHALKVKAVTVEDNGLKWILELDDEAARQITIDMLKEHRSRLRAIIPSIKHTVRQQQARKKERRIDYVIGRMIFFNEDLSAAAKRLREEVAKGEL